MVGQKPFSRSPNWIELLYLRRSGAWRRFGLKTRPGFHRDGLVSHTGGTRKG